MEGREKAREGRREGEGNAKAETGGRGLK